MFAFDNHVLDHCSTVISLCKLEYIHQYFQFIYCIYNFWDSRFEFQKEKKKTKTTWFILKHWYIIYFTYVGDHHATWIDNEFWHSNIWFTWTFFLHNLQTNEHWYYVNTLNSTYSEKRVLKYVVHVMSSVWKRCLTFSAY